MRGMGEALTAMRKAATDSEPLAIYYAFKQSELAEEGIVSAGWASFLQAVVGAGLAIDGTWPVRTELSNRMIAKDANALASSIVLVCRKRSEAAQTVTRADFLRALKSEMPEAVEKIRKASIGPVDMPQSVIGPGMGVFTRYARVLEDDDAPMSVRSALAPAELEVVKCPGEYAVTVLRHSAGSGGVHWPAPAEGRLDRAGRSPPPFEHRHDRDAEPQIPGHRRIVQKLIQTTGLDDPHRVHGLRRRQQMTEIVFALRHQPPHGNPDNAARDCSKSDRGHLFARHSRHHAIVIDQGGKAASGRCFGAAIKTAPAFPEASARYRKFLDFDPCVPERGTGNPQARGGGVPVGAAFPVDAFSPSRLFPEPARTRSMPAAVPASPAAGCTAGPASSYV